MSKLQETRLEIDLKALRFNFKVLKTYLKPETKIMGVVKAFAYGTDPVVIGKELQNLGVDYLAVAFAEEAICLREAGVTCPILVFYSKPKDFEVVFKNNLTPSIYSLDYLRSLNELLTKNNVKNFPIHLKINTGMNRVGFNIIELGDLNNFLSNNESFKCTGVFSHFVAAGNQDKKDFSHQQINSFKQALKSLITILNDETLLHMCNTSGIFNYKEAELNMVRAGIALYGYGNNEVEHQKLKPVLSLKSPIAQLRYIKKGESVGYDQKFIAKEQRKIAVIFLGYADGISRQYGNGNALVEINNQKAPIIGNVCMDAIMIDVTGIECQVGDEVLIFGEGHSAVDFDVNTLSIPYEIITSISQRVSRIVVD